MGTINVAYFKPRSFAGYAVIGPIRASENLTTNNSTSTEGTAVAQRDEVCMITASEDIYVKVDVAPTATTSDLLVKADLPTTLYIPEGEKVGILDVS